MANVFAVHSVGQSLITSLRNAYPASLQAAYPCDFRLMSSGEIANDTANISTTLCLFLHRITLNEYARNIAQSRDPMDPSVPLALDLHYLFIAWANSAEAEHTIMTWAMRQLHLRPVLDSSSLSPEAGWTNGDSVQVIPAELTIEEMMRVWDALEAHYRLTVSYIARVVRVDGDVVPQGPPVVGTEFDVDPRYDYRALERVP